MAYQKVFKNSFIKQLEEKLVSDDKSLLNLYKEDIFPIVEDNCLIDVRITVPDRIELIKPEGDNKYNFENAKIIYEAYKNLPLIKASDPGLWTYLTHVSFWDYTKLRWPNVDKASYILEHWFVRNIGAPDLARNAISSLWWGCYLTYDEKRNDQYELTKQLFSMLDFYRTLIAGVQGRNKEFTAAILEFIIENEKLFSVKKEGKVRLLMRRTNAVGGYKLFTSLEKSEIKEIFKSFKEDLENYIDEE